MKKIELSEEKEQELLAFFEHHVKPEAIKACLESTDEIQPIDYQVIPKDWDDAETDFFNTVGGTIEEKAAFRKMIEIMEKEDIAATIDNLACLPEIFSDELTLLVRKIAKLLQAE